MWHLDEGGHMTPNHLHNPLCPSLSNYAYSSKVDRSWPAALVSSVAAALVNPMRMRLALAMILHKYLTFGDTQTPSFSAFLVLEVGLYYLVS